MPSSCVRAVVVFLLVFLFSLVSAAPSTSSQRNITVDNASSLLHYTPALCNTTFTLNDPLALVPGNCAGTWILIKNDDFSGGSATTTTGTSSSYGNVAPGVSFTFAGTTVAWRTTSYPDGRGGLASVQIDNALPVLVNTSSLLPGDAIVFNALGFRASGLNTTQSHTITVKLVPQVASDVVQLLDIDAFEYTEVAADDTVPAVTTSSETSSSSSATSTASHRTNPAFSGALIALCICGSMAVLGVVVLGIMTVRRRKRRPPIAEPAPPTEDRHEHILTIRPRSAYVGNHHRGQSLVSPLMTEHVIPGDTVRSGGGYVYG